MISERPKAGPFAVFCYNQHGKVYLTEEEYNTAMDNPDLPWCCPICLGPAEWDDRNYEDWQQYGGEG